MKALVLSEYNQPLTMVSVETPKPGPHEILLRVSACGICGTDLKICSGLLPPPIVTLPHIPGHEIAGEVVSVGSQVESIRPGQRGIAYLYLPCRDCEMCRTGRENVCFSVKRLGFELPGGFSEFVKLPAYNFCAYDETMPAEHMAVLPDAVATSYHAVTANGRVQAGESVLIVGCGGLGIHALQIAKLMGASTIAVDRRSEPLNPARDFESDFVINTGEQKPRDAVMEITNGRGVDVVIENVGTADTLRWSLQCLKRNGRLVLVGYDPSGQALLPTMDMHYNEWQIFGTRLSTKQELMTVIQLVEQKKIRPVISEIVPWQQANEALVRLQKGDVFGRIVLSFA